MAGSSYFPGCVESRYGPPIGAEDLGLLIDAHSTEE